jgi:hypothetical protein
MMAQREIVSTGLLLAGVALVFAGISSALEFSVPGIIAAVATMAGLLYTGAVWFGRAIPRERSVLIFDRQLIVVNGTRPGQPVGTLFAAPMRRDVEQRCREAFDGRSVRFSIQADPDRRRFEVAPIRTADGLVAYGILLSGAMIPAISREQLTPVA